MTDRRSRGGLRRALGAVPLVLILAFLAAPMVVMVVTSFSATTSLGFPPQGFSLRWYEQVLGNPAWRESMTVSLLLIVLVVPTVVVLAGLGGYAVGLGRFRGRGPLRAFFLSPLLVPEVMLGLALLLLFQTLGVLDSLASMWLAHSVVALPFGVRAVLVSTSAFDETLIRASTSLGAGPLTTFWRVTVPSIRPGLVSAGVFAGVISLGEVAVSAFVSGSSTTTVPLRILSAMQFQLDPSAAAASTIVLVVCVVLVAVLERTVKLSRVI